MADHTATIGYPFEDAARALPPEQVEDQSLFIAMEAVLQVAKRQPRKVLGHWGQFDLELKTRSWLGRRLAELLGYSNATGHTLVNNAIGALSLDDEELPKQIASAGSAFWRPIDG